MSNLVINEAGRAMAAHVDSIETGMWLRIGEEIKRQGMSLKGFAAKSGVDSSTIIKSINTAAAGGAPSDIKMTSVIAMANTLGRSVNWMVHGIDDGGQEATAEAGYVDFLLKKIFSTSAENDYASKLVGILALLTDGQREAIRQHILNLL